MPAEPTAGPVRPPEVANGNTRPPARPQWLSRTRITLPKPVEGYVERPALLRLCDPSQRGLTALSAPEGFGKTTLLAAVCRKAREDGHLVAWLGLDDSDHPARLLSHAILSFTEAGLEVQDEADVGSDSASGRLPLLMRSIERHRDACVLALDDVHRLDEERLDLVGRIMRQAPPNLHFAMAWREQPRRLAVAPWILQGRGLVVTVEELRFKKPEIARFFGTSLSRKELTALAESSKGWPFALRVQRNVSLGAIAPAAAKQLAGNWIETSLMRDVRAADRELIECAGMFRRTDEDVIDGLLGQGSARRLRGMRTLAGLIETHDDAQPRALALHPLLNDYCVGKLARRSPERFGALHVSAARLLAARGDVAGAMRHAVEGGDPTLAATILENAGAIRFWLRYGSRRTQDADKLLPEEMFGRFPRLALVRCVGLTEGGRLDEADRLYAATYAGTKGMTRDREGGSDTALRHDDLIYRGMRALFGCKSVADPDVHALRSAGRRLADHPDCHGRGMAVLKLGLAMFAHQGGDFASASEWAHQANADDGRYARMYSLLQLGATAFAEGRSDDARRTYTGIRSVAENRVLYDTGPAFAHAALMAELEAETVSAGLQHVVHAPASFEQIESAGAWLDVYVAAIEASATTTLRREGPAATIDVFEQALDFARRTGRPALRQCLAGLYAEMLALAGNLDAIAPLWAAESLPRSAQDILDRTALGWRERECIARGRLLWLLARRQLDAAQELADAFVEGTRADGLGRSQSWALALAVAVAQEAGDTDAAHRHLAAYLRLYARTGYARALMRMREQTWPLLKQMDERELTPALRRARAACIRALQAVQGEAHVAPPEPAPRQPHLSERELDIVVRLDSTSDREIGDALGLSLSGVRYHIRNIFRKLDVNDRHVAARRAQQLGAGQST